MPETPDEPPAFAGENSCWLPRSQHSPRMARRLLASLLAQIEGGHRFLDTGLLLVSELVTNAVVHGTPRENLVWLSLDLDKSRLRIEVHDARSDRDPVLHAVTGDDESGRGLFLVKSLSQRWGCCPRAHVGKIVWCEVSPASEETAVAS